MTVSLTSIDATRLKDGADDFYEEGTFTPTLIGTSTTGSVTYGRQAGYFTRVGNLVTWTLNITTTAFTGFAGNVQIDSLPYTASSGSSKNAPGQKGVHSGLTLTSGHELGCYVLQGTAKVVLIMSDNVGNDAVAQSLFSATNNELTLGGHYYV